MKEFNYMGSNFQYSYNHQGFGHGDRKTISSSIRMRKVVGVGKS